VADLFIHFEQFLAQFPEAMKGIHFALRLAQLSGRGKGLADRFPVHFASQAEVGAVAGLVRLMTTALRFATAAANGADRTAAEISEMGDAGHNGGSLLFEGNERVGRSGLHS
jgi:hypothetical protein